MRGVHGTGRFWKAWRLEARDPRKKSRPVPGTAQVVAWNLIPQRPCTAVTLFAAIPRQGRQQTVDSSVTCTTRWRHFQTTKGASACAGNRVGAGSRSDGDLLLYRLRADGRL